MLSLDSARYAAQIAAVVIDQTAIHSMVLWCHFAAGRVVAAVSVSCRN